MPRARDPNRDKAYEIYKQNNGLIELVDIAKELIVPDGTIRGWKNKDHWDDKLNGTFHTEVERNGTKEERSWIEIEKEYVTDTRNKPISIQKLADKYKIPIQTIKDQSARGQWAKKRKEYKQTTVQKVIEKTSNKDADRIVRLLGITDEAMAKAEQSLSELESYLVKNKRKTKVVEYKDPNVKGKVTKEIINEEESLETVSGPIDRQGLLFVTNALKNIKELYAIIPESEERKARTDALRAKSLADAPGDSDVVISLEGDLDEWGG